MRRLLALLALPVCAVLIAAACGSSSVSIGGTDTDTAADAPADVPAAPAEEPADAPAEEVEPAPTAVPEPTPTPEPTPEPLNVVGLQPLPGVSLDFAAAPIERSGLVWSLYSGSGGVIVENVGGPLPPGCHGTSFFDPETFALLQIDGKDAHAYASVDNGCGGMQQDVGEGVVDGDAVKVNDDDLIQFDFGNLPPPPFDVSTQILNPEGDNGIFRAADPDDPLVVNDLSGATHAMGVTGLFGIDPDTGLLSPIDLPAPSPGPGCDEFVPCLHDGRFQLDLIDAEGSPASVLAADEAGGLFFFFSPDNWDALVKVLNGCGINDHFWVFAAASTDVEYTLTVTDTASGESRDYGSLGQALPAITDTAAFATCP